MINVSRRVRSTAPRSPALRLAVAALAGGWVLSAAAAPAARGQMLAQCPADAALVLKVNHLAETNTKVAALLQTLGVVDLVGDAAKDPLRTFEDKLGLPPASIDDKRDGGFFMPNAASADESERGDPPLVLLLPVTDYKAFLAGTTVVRTDGDVSVVHFKDQTEDAFVAHWGDYAALTPRRELLAGKHDGLKATGAAGRELDGRDLCLFVNFPALKGFLQPALAKQRTKFQAQAEQQMAGTEAAKKQLAHAAIDQAFNVADRFLQDAEPTTVGLNVGKAGLTQTTVVGFHDGSYLANLLGHLRTTEAPLLAGLPDEKYIFFGGSVQDPKKLTQLIDDLAAPLLPKLAALGDNGDKIKSMLDMYKSAMADSEGGSIGLVVPTAAMGQGSLVRYIAVLRADAQKLKDAQEQAAQVQASLMAGLGVPGADLTKTTVTKGAKTVDGVVVRLGQDRHRPRRQQRPGRPGPAGDGVHVRPGRGQRAVGRGQRQDAGQHARHRRPAARQHGRGGQGQPRRAHGPGQGGRRRAAPRPLGRVLLRPGPVRHDHAELRPRHGREHAGAAAAEPAPDRVQPSAPTRTRPPCGSTRSCPPRSCRAWSRPGSRCT